MVNCHRYRKNPANKKVDVSYVSASICDHLLVKCWCHLAVPTSATSAWWNIRSVVPRASEQCWSALQVPDMQIWQTHQQRPASITATSVSALRKNGQKCMLADSNSINIRKRPLLYAYAMDNSIPPPICRDLPNNDNFANFRDEHAECCHWTVACSTLMLEKKMGQTDRQTDTRLLLYTYQHINR